MHEIYRKRYSVVQISTNQPWSDLCAIYTVHKAVFYKKCLVPTVQEAEHIMSDGEESGHIAAQLVDSV